MSFSDDIKRFRQKTEKRGDTVVRKTVIDLMSRVVNETPVDTGRAKGNWQVGVNQEPQGTVETTDKQGNATVSKGTSEALRGSLGDVWYITNNLPYIGVLEAGSSAQAPKGFVRNAAKDADQMLKRAARGS